MRRRGAVGGFIACTLALATACSVVPAHAIGEPEVASSSGYPAIAVLIAPIHVDYTWFHGGSGDTRDLTLRVESTVPAERTLHVVFPAIDGVLIKRLELTLRAAGGETTVDAVGQWATDHVLRGRPSGGDLDDVRGLVVLASGEWWEQRSVRGAVLLVARSSTSGVTDQLFGEFVVPSF